jgi:heme-degrading monooxygenase HmoA
MHATLFTYPLPPEHLENLVAGVKENTQHLPDTPGFQHGYWMYDRERSTVYAVVVFDSAEQAQAAWEEAGPRVTETFKMMGITPDPRMCEVAYHV